MPANFLRSILKQPKLPSTKISQYALDSARGKLSDSNQLKFLRQFKKHIIKQRFATFGQNSGNFV